MLLKLKLSISILAFLCCTTTDALAVIGHPAAENATISKQEKRKLKRQQKLLNWVAKIRTSKLGEHIESFKILTDSTSCDTIVLNNGKQIQATIAEVKANGVKYILCSNPNSSGVLLSLNAIKELRYENGEVDDLVALKSPKLNVLPRVRNDEANSTPTSEMEQKRAKGTGIAVGLLAGSFFYLGALYLLFCLYLLRKKPKAVRTQILNAAWVTYGICGLIVLLFIALGWLMV